MRLLVQWNLVAKTRPAAPDRPVRSRLRLRRRRRGRARRAGCGPGSDPDHLGNAALGERRQESERDADPHRRLHELHARDRVAVLGTLHGLPVRAVLLDLERAEPPALPQPAVRRAGPLGRAERTTRSSPLPAYSGVKAGNPRAQIAIGETSPRGSDKPTGLRPTHTPGKFAELVAKANPRLKFDAWAHHPYPSNPNSPPSQLVKWPNVTLASLPRFDDNLKKWFKRKTVPIWITEYGHQTQPEARSACRTRPKPRTSSSRSRWRRAIRS